MKKCRQYEYNGEYLTCREIAEKAGIRQRTLEKRLQAGWTMERATTAAVQNKTGGHLYDGRLRTLRELSLIDGVPASTIEWRLRHNIPLEDAVWRKLPGRKAPKQEKPDKQTGVITRRKAAVMVIGKIVSGEELPVRRLSDWTWIYNGGICLYEVQFEAADRAVLTAYSRKTKGVMLRRVYEIVGGKVSEVAM